MILAEEFRSPLTGELIATNTILPGSTPGELAYWVPGGVKWDGKMEGVDSATFALSALVKQPFRIRRSADGALVREEVTLSGTVVVGVESAVIYESQVSGAASRQDTVSAAPTDSPTADANPETAVGLPNNEKTNGRPVGSASQLFVDGTYGLVGGNYAIRVEKVGDSLVVVEPNKRSEYTPQADGTYRYTSPKTQSVFGIRVIDSSTIEAFVVGKEGDSSRLEWIGSPEEFEQAAVAAKAAEIEQENRRREEAAQSTAYAHAMMKGLIQGFSEGVADYQQTLEDQNELLGNIERDAAYVEQLRSEIAAADRARAQQISTSTRAEATISASETTKQYLAQQEVEKSIAVKSNGKQQAGTNKILPSKIQLSTATNSIAPTSNQPAPTTETSNMAQGKVRLCNRPGDEGPAHWPICPEYLKKPGQQNGQVARNSGDGTQGVSSPGGSGIKNMGGGSGSQDQGQPGSGETSSSRPQAMAWCMQTKGGNFKCWGPLGKKSPWPTLKEALIYSDCDNGVGDFPEKGDMNLFDCQRKLSDTNKAVPEDPPAPW
ncbi:hypothetical protein [Metapseudomonas resinovorans]|uniref:hypothetical protein n=1 Tax=Metapseudomonas resinovorans TaxID=53412 RepID=UPI00131B40F0|nr:hypothetical protein [Pseudomonas resinovorans]